MDLDDLFGDGLELGDDFLVKAQLKMRIKEARVPAAQDLISKLETAYDERLDLLLADVLRILKGADARKAIGLYVIDGGLSGDDDLQKAILVDDIFKAAPGGAPAAPKAAPHTLSGAPRGAKGQGPQAKRVEMTSARAGSRGGKWYLTKTGKIRYGTKPSADDEREATTEEVAEHIKHFRPGPFMGLDDGDQALVDHILENHEELGFSPGQAHFMQWWYGSKEGDAYSGGDGLNSFIETFWPLPQAKTEAAARKLQRKQALEAMKGDLSNVRLGNAEWGIKDVSFQEAVMHFFSKQNFYSEDDLPQEEIDELFETKVKPVLEDLFDQYESLKTNPAVHDHLRKIAESVEKDDYHFYVKAHDVADKVKGWSDAITASAGDPKKQVTHTLAAMSAMNLLIIPTGKQKAAHLKGVIVPNQAIFGTNSALLKNDPKRLEGLNPDQLMLVYMGTQLDGMFDPDTRKYDHTTGHHDTKLGDHVLDLISQQVTGLDETGKELIKQRLDESAALLAQNLTNANTGKDVLLKLTVMNGESYLKDPEAAAKLQKKMEELERLRKAALEAQTDDKFDLPKAMADGVLGAVHHGDSPLPHHKLLDKDGNEQVDPVTGKVKTFSLFKHQRQSINWMKVAKRGLLALDAGMGKTPTVITFCEHMRELGHLKEGEQVQLYLPPSVMNQWPGEIEKYAPGIKKEEVLNLSGMSLAQRKAVLTSDVAKKAKYILISTGTLNGSEEGAAGKGPKYDESGELVDDGSGGTDGELTELLKGIKGPVFIDEVHTGGFKDEATMRHKIAKAVMADREHAFGMTATPMANSPMDLYHLTNLFAPGTVGTKEEWQGSTQNVKFDEEAGKWELGNPQALMEVRDRVRPFVMSRMITDPEVVADIGQQLGDKFEDPDLTPISPDEDHPWYEHTKPGGKIDILHEVLFQRILKRAKEKDQREGKGMHLGVEVIGPHEAKILDSADYIRGGLRDSLHRQAGISPELYDKSYKAHQDMPGGGSPKIAKMVDDIVKHFKGGGGTQDAPCVIFSSLPGKAFAIVKRELVKAGFDPSQIGEIHGGKSARERSFEQDMTNAGKRKILLVGTKSGGAGLNLQKKANRVFYLDSPADPASKRQAVGRVWRPGQKNPVIESNLMMASKYGRTWDEKNSHNLAMKQALVSAMLSNIDLTAVDFTKPASDAIKQIGAATTDKAKQQKIKITPEIEALAASIDIDELLKDPDGDTPGAPQKLEDYINPAKREALTSEAKGLVQKMDVKEEKRLWDRQYDMNAMPTKWRTQEVLLAAAKTPEEKTQAKAGVEKLAKQCAGWYSDICAEAAAAEKAGEPDRAAMLTGHAEKFQQAMPQINMKDLTETAAKMAENPALAQPKAPAKPKLGTDKTPAAVKKKDKKPEAKAAAKPAGKKEAAPKKAEEKKPSFSMPTVSPFSPKKHPNAHTWWTAVQQAKPDSLAAAKKALKVHLETAGEYAKKDIPEAVEQIMNYFKQHKALVF